MKKRVVITGLGMLTPLGNSVDSSWQGILAGRSGVRPITHFDASDLPVRISASVQNFDPSELLNTKETRKMDLFVQYAYMAAVEALKDAKIEVTDDNADRIGVAVGSGIGGLPWIERNHEALLTGGSRKVSPFFIPAAIINMAAGFISIKEGIRGPNISIVTACTTGSHNIGHAGRMIAYGDADIMVAGGTEMATSRLGVAGFAAVRALSKRNDEPAKASRPWDRDRDGFVLGDGAGMLILEELEHAKARGATIYAELTGFGMSADGYHITAPDPDLGGFKRAMRNALNDADLNSDAIDYVNAHGTSTPAGDPLEALALEKVFGARAMDKQLAVSSTKSMTGHLLGAAGAIEAIFSVLAIRDQIAPPTINLDHPSEECRLNFVPHEAQKMAIKHVLSNSFGFGGTNASLIFSQYK